MNLNILIPVIFMVLLVWIIYMINTTMNDAVDIILRRRLRNKILSALSNKNNRKDDFLILSKSMGLPNSYAHKEFLRIQSMIVTGELKNTDDLSKDLLNEIIIDYEKKSPYEDFPPEIRQNLEQIFNNYHGNSIEIDNLNMSIRTILQKNNKEERAMKLISYTGTLITVVSFVYALMKS